MSDRTRNILITVGIVVLLVVCLFGGIALFKNLTKEGASATLPQVFTGSDSPSAISQDSSTSSNPGTSASGLSAEEYFVPTNTLPECFPVNGPWLEAFGNGLVYEFDPADPIFDQSAFYYFEGVVVPSTPVDLHSTFEMTEKFVAEQGNVWTCGVVTDPKVKHTIIFQSTNKKWQNWNEQPDQPFHDMIAITQFGRWPSEAGVQPAWALEKDDTNMVCPFTTVSMNNPAGVIQDDGSFVGAPGKAGCDFVAIYPDGSAVRYEDAIDSFPYPAGTRFFLFEKSMTNEEVAKAINVASVTNSWK